MVMQSDPPCGPTTIALSTLTRLPYEYPIAHDSQPTDRAGSLRQVSIGRAPIWTVAPQSGYLADRRCRTHPGSSTPASSEPSPWSPADRCARTRQPGCATVRRAARKPASEKTAAAPSLRTGLKVHPPRRELVLLISTLPQSLNSIHAFEFR